MAVSSLPPVKHDLNTEVCRPILTPKTVLPIFFAIGIIFAPIGGLLLYASERIQELRIDYTDCNSTANGVFSQIPESKVHSSFRHSNGSTSRPQWKLTHNTTRPPWSVEIENTPVCTLQFTLPNDLPAPVYLYYRLTNFYQNHRRYVKSLDTDQLKGHRISNSTIHNSACNPLRTNGTGFAYYPCGLIANSIFNDTINSPVLVTPAGNQPAQPYKMTNDSIAWSSDASLYKKTQYTNDEVAPPPNWHRRYPNGYNDQNPIPNLSEYQEFQVWMRTAGLPTFSKLALRNTNETMVAGTYTMDIYDCTSITYPCSAQCPTVTMTSLTAANVGDSLPSANLQRNEINPHQHSIRGRRKEFVPGYRVRCDWWVVYCARCAVYCCAFDSA
jgi:hypothetical protein